MFPKEGIGNHKSVILTTQIPGFSKPKGHDENSAWLYRRANKEALNNFLFRKFQSWATSEVIWRRDVLALKISFLMQGQRRQKQESGPIFYNNVIMLKSRYFTSRGRLVS